VAKRCEIGSWLLLITNRNSHIAFPVTRKSLTLDDLEDHYALNDTSRVRKGKR